MNRLINEILWVWGYASVFGMAVTMLWTHLKSSIGGTYSILVYTNIYNEWLIEAILFGGGMIAFLYTVRRESIERRNPIVLP